MRTRLRLPLGVSLALLPALASLPLFDCSSPDPSVNFPATNPSPASSEDSGATTTPADTGTVTPVGSTDATASDAGGADTGASADASDDGG
jgi:hypothetical protein